MGGAERGQNTAVDHLLASVLREDPAGWPDGASAGLETAVLDAAQWHGVSPLLTHRFHRSGAPPGWPASVLARLAEDARAHTVHEPLLRAESLRVLEALRAADIRPVLVKGTHLAYSHYSNPCLRPRGDTDLLIEKTDRGATAARTRCAARCACWSASSRPVQPGLGPGTVRSSAVHDRRNPSTRTAMEIAGSQTRASTNSPRSVGVKAMNLVMRFTD